MSAVTLLKQASDTVCDAVATSNHPTSIHIENTFDHADIMSALKKCLKSLNGRRYEFTYTVIRLSPVPIAPIKIAKHNALYRNVKTNISPSIGDNFSYYFSAKNIGKSSMRIILKIRHHKSSGELCCDDSHVEISLTFLFVLSFQEAIT